MTFEYRVEVQQYGGIVGEGIVGEFFFSAEDDPSAILTALSWFGGALKSFKLWRVDAPSRPAYFFNEEIWDG